MSTADTPKAAAVADKHSDNKPEVKLSEPHDLGNQPRTVGTGGKSTAADQEEFNPVRGADDGTLVLLDADNKDGEFRAVEDFAPDYDKALEVSEDVRAKARESLPFTKEGAEKAAEKLAETQAIGAVVGYTTHPDTPVKLTPEVKTPSLNDAEAKAKALNVPVGVV